MPRKKKAETPPAPAVPVAQRTLSLKEIRTQVFNCTIVDMAKLLGTTRSTYWFWETEKRKMPGVFAERIKELISKRQPAMTQDQDASV